MTTEISELTTVTIPTEQQATVDNIVGDGTSSNPFIITSIAEFELIKLFTKSHFKLGNDLDFSGYTYYPPTVYLSVKFDGDYKWIRNITITVSSYANAPRGGGIFGAMDNGDIRNCKFTNIRLTASNIANLNHGLLASSYTGNIFNVILQGTVSVTGNAGRVGGLIGEYRVTDNSYIHHVDMNVNISHSASNITANITYGGIIGMIHPSNKLRVKNVGTDGGTEEDNTFYNVVRRGTGSFSGTVGSRLYSSSGYININGNPLGETAYGLYMAQWDNNSHVGDGTNTMNKIAGKTFSLSTVNTNVKPYLNTTYWNTTSTYPALRMARPPKISNARVKSYVVNIKSDKKVKRKKSVSVESYIKPIVVVLHVDTFTGKFGKDNVSSYMAYAYSDRRVEIKSKRTSYILNINSKARITTYKKTNRLIGYVTPITASATIVGASKSRLVNVSSHAEPITSSSTSFGLTVVRLSSHMTNSINTNVSVKVDVKRSSNMSEIHSDRHVYAKSNVSSHLDGSENSVETIRIKRVKVVTHVDALESNLTITKKIKTITLNAYTSPITSTYHKTQIKYVEKSSYLGLMGARVIKGGYVRFSSHMKRNKVVGKSWRYVKTTRFPISYSDKIVSKANVVYKLQKNVSSYLGIVNADTRIRANFFLPKMVRVKGRIKLNRSLTNIKTNKSVIRYTGNTNSSYSDDWGDDG